MATRKTLEKTIFETQVAPKPGVNKAMKVVTDFISRFLP